MRENNNWDRPCNYRAIDETEIDLCRLLWKCVAVQNVIDAKARSLTPEVQQIKESALDWLNGEGENAEDFEMVCELAGFEPNKTREVFLAHVEGDTNVDFRCLKKEMPDNCGREERSNYLRRLRYQEKMKKARFERKLEPVD